MQSPLSKSQACRKASSSEGAYGKSPGAPCRKLNHVHGLVIRSTLFFRKIQYLAKDPAPSPW